MERFAPYVKDTATAMLKVFDFELGEDVREIAFEVERDIRDND